MVLGSVELEDHPMQRRAHRKFDVMRAAAAEEQAKLDRLEKFAGVSGTDADGRRLDQREFAETRKASWDTCISMPRGLGNGQSWYAWRRTISGWHFGIGSAGPPPDQWLYDGPAASTGFPGSAPGWNRFGTETTNW